MKFGKLFLAGAICFFLSGCLVQSPTINYKNNEAVLNGLDSVRTQFNFNMHNPNILPLNGQINYTFFVEAQEFFTGQSDQISAPANGDTEFALKQDISFDKIFGSASELVNAIAKGQKSIKVRVAGEYRTKALGIFDVPIKIDQEAEVPLPDIQKELTDQLNSKTGELTEQLKEQLTQDLLENLSKIKL